MRTSIGAIWTWDQARRYCWAADLPRKAVRTGKYASSILSGIAGATARIDHESQIVSTPSSRMLFSSPAFWRHDDDTWLFAADNAGTAAWTLRNAKLEQIWKNSNGGTSPVVAGGMLFVYDAKGGLFVYDPIHGRQIANLPCGVGHWNSPIVVEGRIALPEGDAIFTARWECWTSGRCLIGANANAIRNSPGSPVGCVELNVFASTATLYIWAKISGRGRTISPAVVRRMRSLDSTLPSPV